MAQAQAKGTKTPAKDVAASAPLLRVEELLRQMKARPQAEADWLTTAPWSRSAAVVEFPKKLENSFCDRRIRLLMARHGATGS